jgi:hypothetical protein
VADPSDCSPSAARIIQVCNPADCAVGLGPVDHIDGGSCFLIVLACVCLVDAGSADFAGEPVAGSLPGHTEGDGDPVPAAPAGAGGGYPLGD